MWAPSTKCIVKDCINRTSEGEFIGELCSPCHEFITEGNGVHSQAYRNATAIVAHKLITPASFEKVMRSVLEIITS